MEIYVYSDESGVFDKVHNEVFVFGGLIFLKKKDMEICSRKYLTAENAIRAEKYAEDEELKACRISNKEKGKLYRSLNQTIKFGVVINQNNVLDRIFQSKKDKQRYLDYAYKIGMKMKVKKATILTVWLFLTVLYCWNLSDIGRSMGANTNSAIENYAEYYTQEYIGAEGAVEGIANAWSYSEFNNLSKKFKGDFMVVGITTVIYVVVTVAIYHFLVKKEKKMDIS